MSRTLPTLALALACSSLGAQQHDERPMLPGTWDVRFAHNDRL